jgi:hypothetical protein
MTKKASLLAELPSLGMQSTERGKVRLSRKAVVARLVAQNELSPLEASWLLKAWQLGGVSKTRDPFASYLAGFFAGIALKTVRREVKSGRN